MQAYLCRRFVYSADLREYFGFRVSQRATSGLSDSNNSKAVVG